MKIPTLFALFGLLSSFCSADGLTVCIDPGHPSEVGRGTTGKLISELSAAWKVALKLRDRLESKGIYVVLTKQSEKEFVTNKRRAQIANEANADLMIRLHCDASALSGFATYYPTKKGKARDGKTGPSADVLALSATAAKAFHQAFSKVLKGFLVDGGLLSDLKTAVGAKQGALTGSIYSKVPVLLVEMVVLTNSKDDKFIASAKGQNKMADALASGVIAALKATGAWKAYSR